MSRELDCLVLFYHLECFLGTIMICDVNAYLKLRLHTHTHQKSLVLKIEPVFEIVILRVYQQEIVTFRKVTALNIKQPAQKFRLTVGRN